MKHLFYACYELKNFLLLWVTQALSALGSSMTNFALVVWSYQQEGSALTTAMLSVSSYAPYVVMSIFAGALSDRWDKKKTMLLCDSFAALCTLAVLVLLETGQLEIWHLYLLNALNGLMNTVQQPASDVAVSLLTPKKYYHRVSGMRSFSSSLVNIAAPVAATALLGLVSLQAVIWFDLATFGAAFLSLALLIRIPREEHREQRRESVLQGAAIGLRYLRDNLGILHLMLFLAAINLIASVYQAALPAMLLSRSQGDAGAVGMVNACSGAAMLAGSILASAVPEPKSRVRVICNTLLLSMSTENFLLALGRSLPVWCAGAVLGWLGIPLMNANMDVLFRSYIPIPLQGRVYSARNTLQFFTIPLGYLLGGFLVDQVFEPFMAAQPQGSVLTALFGSGKGSGAALLFLVLGFAGLITCLVFRKDRHIWDLEKQNR